MKFLISFVAFDTTVGEVLLGNHSSMSAVQHEIVSTDSAEYSACGSVRDVEAAFEGICNYVYSDDDVTRPESKVKVIKIEALPKG
ncbi:hypothetical protein [Pseudomonas sivasensis]|uniref:hypothetical protein n=1 Tax=Pseudomonas sivasensis TaxID=1880678 RepID=UPI003BA2C309